MYLPLSYTFTRPVVMTYYCPFLLDLFRLNSDFFSFISEERGHNKERGFGFFAAAST